MPTLPPDQALITLAAGATFDDYLAAALKDQGLATNPAVALVELAAGSQYNDFLLAAQKVFGVETHPQDLSHVGAYESAGALAVASFAVFAKDPLSDAEGAAQQSAAGSAIIYDANGAVLGLYIPTAGDNGFPSPGSDEWNAAVATVPKVHLANAIANASLLADQLARPAAPDPNAAS